MLTIHTPAHMVTCTRVRSPSLPLPLPLARSLAHAHCSPPPYSSLHLAPTHAPTHPQMARQIQVKGVRSNHERSAHACRRRVSTHLFLLPFCATLSAPPLVPNMPCPPPRYPSFVPVPHMASWHAGLVVPALVPSLMLPSLPPFSRHLLCAPSPPSRFCPHSPSSSRRV